MNVKRILAALVAVMASAQLAYPQSRNITKAFLTGHINYTRDTSFIKISHKYTDRKVYLQKATYTAYQKMYAAALKEGVVLSVISGTRSFYDQHYKWYSKWTDPEFSGIRDKKVKAQKLLSWWSMPGTSRHHWGTDLDLVNLSPSFYATSSGKKVYNWLVNNAHKFGFYQPFNAGRSIGYKEEKWHWSYLPLAKVYLQQYIKQISYADLNGFPGSEAAKELDVIKSQVLAINLACK